MSGLTKVTALVSARHGTAILLSDRFRINGQGLLNDAGFIASRVVDELNQSRGIRQPFETLPGAPYILGVTPFERAPSYRLLIESPAAQDQTDDSYCEACRTEVQEDLSEAATRVGPYQRTALGHVRRYEPITNSS